MPDHSKGTAIITPTEGYSTADYEHAKFVNNGGTVSVRTTAVIGDIEIGAVELKDATTDARVTAKVDNTAAGTPTPLSVGGKYNATPQAYDDGDQVTSQYTATGALKVALGEGLNTSDEVSVQPNDYATDDTAMPATPQIVPVGGEARDTANSYADGDAVVQQYNRVGEIRTASLDSFLVTKCAPTAFAGGTLNARGDEGGTSDPFTLFTVTGDVLIGVYGVCTTDLTGAGNVSVGPTSNTALFMAALAATSIDQHEVWMDATPAIGKPLDSLNFYVLGNGVDIVEDITTDTVTAGNIYYVALWKPLTPGSNVVSAV